MTERSTDWEDIKTFAAVVRNKTARAAAKSLRVHHSTVSRRIEQLESNLKTRLFDRHPDGYVLTKSGEKLFATARSFEQDLQEVAREMSGSDEALSGILRITMPVPLASYIIAPHLNTFTQQYPDIELQINTSFTLLDLARNEADIAIRMEDNPDNGLTGRRLFGFYQAAYATPDYLAKHDLEQNPRSARWLGRDYNGQEFPDWTIGTGCEAVPSWGVFPDPNVQLAAAKGGLGIALLPCFIADQQPELIRVTSEPPIKSRDMWILTHRDLRNTARVRVFMEFAEQLITSLKPAIVGATR